MTGGAGAGDTGIDHGAALIEFCDAVLGGDAQELHAARRLVERRLGAAALVDAAGVAAYFDGIDRIADATGTMVEAEYSSVTQALREQLSIDEYQEARERLE